MPVFFPTHPEPGDPPGFYGEVYFDGQKVTDRRKPGADPGHYQMTEWYVPVEPVEPVEQVEQVEQTEPAEPVEEAEAADFAVDAGASAGAAPGPDTTVIDGAAPAPVLRSTPSEPSNPAAHSDSGELPVPVPFFVPLTRPRAAFQPAALQPPAVQPAASQAPASRPPAVRSAASEPPFSPGAPAAVLPSPLSPSALTEPTAEEIKKLFDDAIDAVRKLPTDVLSYDDLDTPTVELLHRKNAELTRLVGVRMAMTADQIAQRSAADLAGAGMARQFGDRTAIEMIKNLGGLTQQDAMAALRTGRMMREDQSTPPEISTENADPGSDLPDAAPVRLPAPPPGPTEPWLQAVSRAVRDERLSSLQADKIRTGLGAPTASITAAMLAAAAELLIDQAHGVTPDRVWKLARQTRDRLDRSGVALREAERRAMRSARLFQRSDGMMQLIWVMDPEQGMQLRTLVDRSISPKSGGPRVGGTQADVAARIKDDPRGPEQKLSDDLFHLLGAGAVVDPGNIMATPTASVSILTIRRTPVRADGSATADTPGSATRAGGTSHPVGTPTPHDRDVEHYPTGQYDLGWIEGHPDPVSPETVDRLICSGSTRTVTYDSDGRPLDVGREQRLFGRRQRVALAATFGGCTWTDKNGNRTCERPPSWTEAHHIEHWYRDKGKTVMDNGILLCKLHHLELHNDHWEILRKGSAYWLIPPKMVDLTQTPRLIPIHSEAYRELMNSRPPA